jgi:transcriptional regulator GlxA family with amidase domain
MSSTFLLPLRRECSDKRVVAAFEMLQNSAAEGDLDFVRIARSLNLSTSRLRHLFTTEAGISPTHYVRLVRLQQARRLMLQSFLTVKEVMGHSGFTDISHFVREYKRVFGETPSQTRRTQV